MKPEKKTLIILSPGFPQSEEETTCLPLQQDLIRALKKNYPELSIIVLTFQYPYHRDSYEWLGIPVIPFGGRNKGGLPRLLLHRKIFAQLKDIYQENKIIGLISFWCGECALVGKRFADKYSLKHYCWILGQDARKENHYVKRIKPRADELMALSDFLQDEFENNHGTRPAHLITPGIDPNEFPPGIQQRDIDILGAGSLIPLKQYDLFIEIIAGIRKQFPSVKALLVGDGPEKQRLEKLVANLGLQKNISFAGEIPHPDLLQHMQRTKLFLHVSAYEGFGMVCLEALYGGADVISFVKPMKQDIANWNIVKNREEMVQRAIAILGDKEKKYAPVTVYTIDDTANRVMELLNE